MGCNSVKIINIRSAKVTLSISIDVTHSTMSNTISITVTIFWQPTWFTISITSITATQHFTNGVHFDSITILSHKYCFYCVRVFQSVGEWRMVYSPVQYYKGQIRLDYIKWDFHLSFLIDIHPLITCYFWTQS